MKAYLQSLAISLYCRIHEWNCTHILNAAYEIDEETDELYIERPWHYALGMSISNWINPLWSFGFKGTDEELQMCLDGEIPEHCWDARLRERVEEYWRSQAPEEPEQPLLALPWRG